MLTYSGVALRDLLLVEDLVLMYERGRRHIGGVLQWYKNGAFGEDLRYVCP
jgi:hypothetical protein